MKTAFRVLAATVLASGAVGIAATRAASAATTVADCPTTESQLIDDIVAARPGGIVAFDCTEETTISFTDPITISESVNDLYGQRLVVELWTHLRGELAFESEEQLVEAIAADVEATRVVVRPPKG